MLKYNFKELNKPVVIDEPAVQDIFITNDEITIAVTTAAGQDETKLELEKGKTARFTVQIGNVEPIKFGGTDNWGYNKLILPIEKEANSIQFDSILVNNITVDTIAGDNGWCKCEKVDNNTLKYTALTANPSSSPRYAYFKHKTTDTTISGGQNEGRLALPEWYVTIMQKGNENPQPVIIPSEPEVNQNEDAPSDPWQNNSQKYQNPNHSGVDSSISGEIGNDDNHNTPSNTSHEDDPNLGSFLYKVGLISDLHISADNDSKSPNNANDDWWDEDDFNRAMTIFKNDSDIKFIASCGDTLESGSPKNATPEDDYNVFIQLYDVPYWQVAGLRLFTPMGNHDFYAMFESRKNDIILASRFTNYNSISGYNTGVRDRIANIAISGQGINGMVPGRGRIVFDGIYGDVGTNGQGDMNFFAYNAYVEMYKDAAGFSGSIVPTEARYSDEAFTAMTTYVMNNWNTCKDNLSGWHAGRQGMRNAYSKGNYWTQKGNDLFIFLSVDYGTDYWTINDTWHDRMIHARTIIPTDQTTQENDPYIKRMVEYVQGTGYSLSDVLYNYQYYSPNTLIWLKEIIENNQNKKIYVFTHHFMPHRVGNGDPIHDNLPKNGGYHYSSINKDGVLSTENTSGIQYNSGSNTLTGIEFWFINKLMNSYTNVIWFSGHSHISWENDCHFDNHDYNIILPANDEVFAYTRSSNVPKSITSAWNVALPSLSKPRYVIDGSSSRKWNDAEMGIMEIYEKGVKIKGYKIRKNNQDTNTLLTEKSIKLID